MTIKRIWPSFKTYFAQFFAAIFGKISWSRPAWITSFGQKVTIASPKALIGIGLSLLIILGLVLGTIYWRQHLPAPLTAQVTVPPITPNEKELQPQPLIIKFGKLENGYFREKPVAPIGQVGYTVNKGISLRPTVNGTWEWTNDHQLTFTPDDDWPAQKTYQINFAKGLFTPSAKLDSYQYKFTTQPFKLEVAELKFYQDPVSANIKQVVGTIKANFPLDPASLEAHTQLNMKAISAEKLQLPSQRLSLVFSYDENYRTAYFHSNTLTLASVPRYARLTIDSGVSSASKTAKTTGKIEQQALVPDSASLLKVAAANATIVRDGNDNPTQVLTIETTVGVATEELKQKLHVYLLPAINPNKPQPPAGQIYAWENPGEVTPQILQNAQSVKLQSVPSAQPYVTLNSFKIKVPTPSYLYLVVDGGLNAWGNYTLARDYKTIIKTPDYPQEIRFLHKGALLSLGSEKKLTVLVRGLPTVQFSIGRVLPDDLNHLVTQTYGEFQNPKFINDSFGRDNISQIFSELRHFNIDDPGQLQYTTLDLAKYLTAGAKSTQPLGLFLLKAQAWDEDNDQPLQPITERLVLITDLGFLVKNNADHSHDVFVQSISQGTPVANAEVQVLGRNGLPIISRQTNSEGRANLPDLSDFTAEQQPVVYLVRLKDDVAFMPYDRADRQLNYSQFPIEGVDDTQESVNTAYVFSDRGIYRPGDTMHLGFIVKKPYAQPQTSGLPLEAVITDSRGQTVFDQKTTLPTSGFFTFDYTPADSAPTGTYNIELYIIKDENKNALLGSTTVRVEEFLPDRLRVRTQLATAGTATTNNNAHWLSPIQLQASLQVDNLFGTPAPNRRVQAHIELSPQPLSFPEFPGYVFVDPLSDPKQPLKTFTQDLTEARTNNKGEAQFSLDLNHFAQSAYRLTFSADVFEPDGGRGVGTQVSSLVTPLPQLVGYKADADLNYLQLKSQHSVKLIAIDSKLKPVALSPLHAQFAAVLSVVTLVKNPDGTYQYQTVKKEKPLHTQDFTITPQTNELALSTDTVGDYALTVTDADGRLLTKLYYSVIGPGSQAVVKNTELGIKLNKPIYSAGDTVEMQITAPYSGSGLITIERDKVYAYKWFKAETSNSVQTIQIPTDLKGDAYINVAFVRGWNSDEIFLNPLSYRVTPLRLEHDKNILPIKLTAPELIKPGETLTIQYSTDKPSKIVVYAVDEGILQVANYSLPDPVGYFFRKHALSVTTAQIVDQILPKYLASRELSAVGGDGSNEMLIKNLNPFKRKTQPPVVYWSGILDSDSQPRTLSYQVPNYFNGNVRIMAVAVAEDAVGSAQKNTLVRGDFVISPNVPSFVAPSDTFTVSATIAKNIAITQSTPIQLAVTPQLSIMGVSSQNLEIAEGKEATALFNLRANSNLGNAELTFTVGPAGHQAQITETLSVRPAAAFQTILQSGYTNATSKKLTIDGQWYPQYRLSQILASNNPLILANGLQTYLTNYPYDCTEQLVSKAFAELSLGQQPLIKPDNKTLQSYFNNTIQMLRERQNSNGSINYWPNSSNDFNDHFASVYAMAYLTDAKQNGYPVPDDLFKGGLAYLQQMVTEQPHDLSNARLQAQAIYILTRNEIITSDYLTNLLAYLKQLNPEWQQDITSAYIAAAFKLLQDNTDADRFIKLYAWGKTAEPMDDFNNGLATDAQYLGLLARHFPEQLKQLGEQPIIQLAERVSGDQLNTVAAAYSVNALSAYATTVAEQAPFNLQISAILQNGEKKLLNSLTSQFFIADLTADTKQVMIDNPKRITVFYQLKQAGFNQEQPTNASQHGLEISRDYRDEKRQPITNIKLGSEITVRLQLRSAPGQGANNVAVVDLLPGGFGVVPNSINASGCDYYDLREDRILFYCTATPATTEIIYRLRAENKGIYIVPPILAKAMYNQNLWGRGAGGKLSVVD